MTMNNMKKCITLTVALSALLVNQAVAMGNDFSSRKKPFSQGHQRSKSTSSGPSHSSPKVIITGIDSGSNPSTPKDKSPANSLNDIDGEIPYSPKSFKEEGSPIRITSSPKKNKNPEVDLLWFKLSEMQAHTEVLQTQTRVMDAQIARENRSFFQKLQEPAVLIQCASLLLTAAQVLPPLIKDYYDKKTVNDFAIKSAELKLAHMKNEVAREEMELQQFTLHLKKEARKIQAIERIGELLEKQRNGQKLSEDEKNDITFQRDVMRALTEQNLSAAA